MSHGYAHAHIQCVFHQSDTAAGGPRTGGGHLNRYFSKGGRKSICFWLQHTCYKCFFCTHTLVTQQLCLELALAVDLHDAVQLPPRVARQFGEPQEHPTSELCKDKYPSLTFFKVDALSIGSCLLTVAMGAADIIKFLLSPFARKGQFDEIFERSQGVATTRRRAVKRSPALKAL